MDILFFFLQIPIKGARSTNFRIFYWLTYQFSLKMNPTHENWKWESYSKLDDRQTSQICRSKLTQNSYLCRKSDLLLLVSWKGKKWRFTWNNAASGPSLWRLRTFSLFATNLLSLVIYHFVIYCYSKTRTCSQVL